MRLTNLGQERFGFKRMYKLCFVGVLEVHKNKIKWYLDSGCSRHMTGDKEQFNKLDAKNGEHITFGDNTKGTIIGIGEIGNPQSLSIHHVLFINGIKHNLLSISQLCDMGNKVTFYPKNCFVSSLDEEKVIFSGERVDNVYIIDLNKIDDKDIKCLMSISHAT